MKSPTIGAKSLYGFTKFASEELIKEFSYIKDLNYLINRFGVSKYGNLESRPRFF